jgi:hypothetical protein
VKQQAPLQLVDARVRVAVVVVAFLMKFVQRQVLLFRLVLMLRGQVLLGHQQQVLPA